MYVILFLLASLDMNIPALYTRIDTWISDIHNYYNNYNLSNTAFLMQTVFMIVTAYTMTPKAAVACLSLAVGFGGFAWAGFSVNHLDLAPQVKNISFI